MTTSRPTATLDHMDDQQHPGHVPLWSDPRGIPAPCKPYMPDNEADGDQDEASER